MAIRALSTTACILFLTSVSYATDIATIKSAWLKRQRDTKYARFFVRDRHTTGAGTREGRAFVADLVKGLRKVLPPKDSTHTIKRTFCLNGQSMRTTAYGRRWNAWKEAFVSLDQRKLMTPTLKTTLNNWAARDNDVYPHAWIEDELELDRALGLRPLLMHYRPIVKGDSIVKLKNIRVVPTRETIRGHICIELRQETDRLVRSYLVDPTREYAILQFRLTAKATVELKKMVPARRLVLVDTTFRKDERFGYVPISWTVKRWFSAKKIATINRGKVLSYLAQQQEGLTRI